MKTKLAAVALLLLSGCAPIEHFQTFEQPVGQTLMVGPGDVVAKVNKQRNRENLFGNASIYGSKTNEGYSELRYAGLEKNGTIVFFRKDISIITNETTMSRSPFTSTFANANTVTTANVTGSTFGNQFTGSGTANSNTSANAVTIHPVPEYHVVVPPDTIAIRIPKGKKQFPFEGRLVEIVGADATSLTYKVSELPH